MNNIKKRERTNKQERYTRLTIMDTFDGTTFIVYCDSVENNYWWDEANDRNNMLTIMDAIYISREEYINEGN